MPVFVRHAANAWSVHATGPTTSTVTASATFRMAPWALPAAPALRMLMTRIETRTLDDLKTAAEQRIATAR